MCSGGDERERLSDQNFLPAAEIVHILVNGGCKHTVDSIPDGRKENINYILSDEM